MLSLSGRSAETTVMWKQRPSQLRMENKSFNIVVIHKQSGWSKFKRRLSSWFSSDQGGEPRVVPEIIVTSHEDVPGNVIVFSILPPSHFIKYFNSKKFDRNQQRLKQHITLLQTVILRNIIYKQARTLDTCWSDRALICTFCGTCCYFWVLAGRSRLDIIQPSLTDAVLQMTCCKQNLEN